MSRMRVAWFSPLPPAATGVAGYSADVLPLLGSAGLDIDRYEAINAHDFVWRRRLTPYDLVVYQLGNSQWHDYMWAYLFQYPGMIVLHDPRLHHARAAQLLRARRVDDYRREFAYNHPQTSGAAAEYAIEGLRSTAFYYWPMIRTVVESARLVAVHNEFVAAELRDAYPSARIERIHLGVPAIAAAPEAPARIRRRHDIPPDSVVFAAFGLVTAEKRIEPILRAFSALGTRSHRGAAAHLLLVGANGLPTLGSLIDEYRIADRVHVTGYVPDDSIADYLAAADISLSLRWPTAEETSRTWAESLSASKPTIITALPHTADVPALDASTWRPTSRTQEPVAVSVDLLDEDAALLAAMSRLADDPALRKRLATSGHDYWAREHQMTQMADDYVRLITTAPALPAPAMQNMPAHLTNDYSALAASIAGEIGVEL
jgi:glycosyltransferase involved in cell wall biosynthesis